MLLNHPNSNCFQKLSMIHNQTHACVSQQLMSKTGQLWRGREGAGKTLVTMGTSGNFSYTNTCYANSMLRKSGQHQRHF